MSREDRKSVATMYMEVMVGKCSCISDTSAICYTGRYKCRDDRMSLSGLGGRMSFVHRYRDVTY